MARSENQRRPLRVLVVDDDIETVHGFRLLLELEGHEVQAAYGGEEAVRAAEAWIPDVAFIDIGLPGFDGYLVAEHLRRNPALDSALLVAVTGYGRSADKAKAHAAGYDRHLTKPVDFDACSRLLEDVPRNSTREKP